METELDSESISKPSTVPSCLNNTNHDASNFECNICFELAQDAIITLCGHLFCWPCLYKWLHLHSHSHECPVCKALIEEDKLVPIYGRGTTNSDPRSWSRPGVEIPKRPTGQRPETVPTFHANPFPQQEVRFMPIETLRGVSFMLTIVGGGIFPALFPVLIGFQMLRFSDAAGYGTIMGFQYGGIDSFHGGHAHVSNQHSSREQQYYDSMSRLRYTLLLFGLAVLGFLCFR